MLGSSSSTLKSSDREVFVGKQKEKGKEKGEKIVVERKSNTEM